MGIERYEKVILYSSFDTPVSPRGSPGTQDERAEAKQIVPLILTLRQAQDVVVSKKGRAGGVKLNIALR